MPGECRYPKTERLRRRREFLTLQRSGRRQQRPHFVVIRQYEGGIARLGVTVSAKVGNAVVRNRVKRNVRESFRHVPRPVRAKAAFVVIAKNGAERLSQRQTAAEIAELFIDV